MIKIKIQKLSGDQTRNNIAKLLAKEMNKEYKNFICDIHSKKTSYIIIVVKKTGMRLKKGSFCCPEFKKEVKVR